MKAQIPCQPLDIVESGADAVGCARLKHAHGIFEHEPLAKADLHPGFNAISHT
jgi:hypothetical protein